MIFVSRFVLLVIFYLTNNDEILQLTVRAFRFTSVIIVLVNVHASDCFCLDCVIRCVASFVIYIGTSLTNNNEVLQLTLCALVPLQFVALQSVSQHQSGLLWIVSF